jgi:predicted nucleic acid-binding protein
MSPFTKPVILDNDVISRLYSAGDLRRALEIWPKRSFYITQQVMDEAGRWPAKGAELVECLEDLMANENLVSISIDESSEGEIMTYAKLQLENKLGRGESASIAIAFHRGFDTATDDEVARDACKAMCPAVSIFGTGDILNLAVRDKLITRLEADSIQAKIRRKSKQ